jgi:hypothetical protein
VCSSYLSIFLLGSSLVLAHTPQRVLCCFAPPPPTHTHPTLRPTHPASLGHVSHTAAAPLARGGEADAHLTNSREDNALARAAKLLAFPPSLTAERLGVLLQPLAATGRAPVSHLTSMALLEVVAAVAVGEC